MIKNHITIYAKNRIRLLKLLALFDAEIAKGREAGDFKDLEGMEEIGFWEGVRYSRIVLKDLNIKIYELGKNK
jgi:hypothetical protein